MNGYDGLLKKQNDMETFGPIAIVTHTTDSVAIPFLPVEQEIFRLEGKGKLLWLEVQAACIGQSTAGSTTLEVYVDDELYCSRQISFEQSSEKTICNLLWIAPCEKIYDRYLPTMKTSPKEFSPSYVSLHEKGERVVAENSTTSVFLSLFPIEQYLPFEKSLVVKMRGQRKFYGSYSSSSYCSVCSCIGVGYQLDED